MKNRKMYKDRYVHLWTNNTYLSKCGATVATNKQHKDVKLQFSQAIYQLEAIYIHFSMVKKSRIRHKECLKLMTEDIFLNVKKQSYPKRIFLKTDFSSENFFLINYG